MMSFRKRVLTGLLVGLLLLAGGTAGAAPLGTSPGDVSETATPTVNSTATPSSEPSTASGAVLSSPVTEDAPATPSSTEPVATPPEMAPPTATSTPLDDPSETGSASADIAFGLISGGGGGNNIVQVVNHGDERLKVRGNVQINRIPGPRVEPVNLAQARASCTDCQTYAVALQVNLISRSANWIAPENTAVALNINCSGCRTVALALQYVHQVDDPTEVPPDVATLIRDMDRELNALQLEKNLTVEEAEARILAVIGQYQELNQSLRQQRQEAVEPNSTTGAPTGEVPPAAVA